MMNVINPPRNQLNCGHILLFRHKLMAGQETHQFHNRSLAATLKGHEQVMLVHFCSHLPLNRNYSLCAKSSRLKQYNAK
jgi:hypothetical protein